MTTKEIISAVFPKMEEVETLRSANAALQTELAEVKKEVETSRQTIAAFPGYKTDHDALVATLKAEHAKELETVETANKITLDGLTKQLEEAKSSLNKEVVATLASKGVPVGTIKEEISPTLTPAQIVEQWKSLKGREQQAFYTQHRMTILRAEGLIKQ